MMENQKCKGMKDFLPADMSVFRHIEKVFLDCCHNYGYQEVRTPTLEYLHLFTATGTLTPSMLNKVYSFLDWDGWSGERVVLRPDGTIPIARLYVDMFDALMTAKLCYVTNIFAFESTGHANRERWQCGAEFIGGTRLAADVETIALAKDITEKIGIKNINVQLSHAGLVKALIKEIAFNPEEETILIDNVLDGNWQALIRKEEGEIGKFLPLLLNLKGKSRRFLQNVRTLYPQASPELKSHMEDFINITTLLDGLSFNYEIDITAIQNFEYYTGMCFQLLADGTKIGGGGRYDDLIPLMDGGNQPACGFALYIDSIFKSVSVDGRGRQEQRILIKGNNTIPEKIKNYFILAKSLRELGYSVDINFTQKELSEYHWVISACREDMTSYDIFDQNQQQHWNAISQEEVLKVLAR
jgi:histidyl-tRNA synthetase